MSKAQWPGNLPPINDSTHALAEFRKLSSAWSHETALTTRMLLYVTELLEQIVGNTALQTQRPKRPLTAWQRFFSAHMKLGGTAQSAAAEWKNRRDH